MNSLTIEIPTVLITYAQAALARLGYLYADVGWGFDPDSNCLSARYAPEKHGPEELRKEALFQLYREKIHQDTLGIRIRLYEAI
jgi:hypothetical protein